MFIYSGVLTVDMKVLATVLPKNVDEQIAQLRRVNQYEIALSITIDREITKGGTKEGGDDINLKCHPICELRARGVELK